MIQVPGYYAKKRKKKKRNSNSSTDQTSSQPLESGRAVEPKQPREEEGCNANSFTAPSMCNGFLGVKSLSKIDTNSSIPVNFVIIGDLLENDNLGKDSNDIDEELRKAGRDVEAAEFQNNTKSREVLSDAHETLPISCAPHVAPRASSSNENRRILPGWKRRQRYFQCRSKSRAIHLKPKKKH